jgi:YVTN family beta-propeller protein
MNNKRPAATVKRIVGALSAVMLFSLPMSGAVAKDTGYIFVSSENDNAVTVLDGKTHAVVKTIATGERPRDMKLNAARDKLYVIASNSERVDIIDIAKLAVERSGMSARTPRCST